MSGGEAQRVKLASELQKRSTGKTVYVLDEPTTGLHFEDIRKLLGVLSRLVDQGNSVIVIEHNLDVIKTADWLIDLGPEGGNKGGLVVAEGTPEDVAKVEASHTGRFLRPVLEGRHVQVGDQVVIPAAAARALQTRGQSSVAAKGPRAKKTARQEGDRRRRRLPRRRPAKKATAKKTSAKKAVAKRASAKKALPGRQP